MRTPNPSRRRRGTLRRLLALVHPVASVSESGSSRPVITLVPIAPRHAGEPEPTDSGDRDLGLDLDRRRAA